MKISELCYNVGTLFLDLLILQSFCLNIYFFIFIFFFFFFFFLHVVMIKRSCIKPWLNFANLLLCKVPAKNGILEDVKSRAADNSHDIILLMSNYKTIIN